MSSISRIPADLSVDERNRRGLQGYWNYLSSDLFTAWHELSVAGRTDPELQAILHKTSQAFDDSFREVNEKLFPE